MKFTHIVDIKARIASSADFEPAEREFILGAINAAIAQMRRELQLDLPPTPPRDLSLDFQAAKVLELSNTLFELIRPHLAGKGRDVQGGALADLVARWLAGLMDARDRIATWKLREEFLRLHVSFVRSLIEPNCRQLGTTVTHERPELEDETEH